MFSLTPTSEACIGNSRVLRFETKVKLLLHPQRVEELRESREEPSFCCPGHPPAKLRVKAVSFRSPCI